MNEKSFKQEFLEAVMQGLVEGGYPEDAAKSLWPLFETIYDSGYKEARRNIKEELRWSARY